MYELVEIVERGFMQPFPGLDSLRVQTGAGEFVHGPLHNLHLLYRHRTVALQRSQFGKLRL